MSDVKPTARQVQSALEWAGRFGHTETGWAAKILAAKIRQMEQDRLAERDQMPITPEWLRSATTLPVCKNGSGGYSDSDVTLFLDDWQSRQKEDHFWVASFRDDGNRGWRVSVSVQENGRHGGTLYMAHIKTCGEFLRVAAVLNIPLPQPAAQRQEQP